jgi:hypothetical protein
MALVSTIFEKKNLNVRIDIKRIERSLPTGKMVVKSSVSTSAALMYGGEHGKLVSEKFFFFFFF